MRFKRSSIFIKIVVLALVVCAAVSIAATRSKIAAAAAEREKLRTQVDEALQKNAELEYDIAHASDNETIAEIARTKLGLVEPGEKIFCDVGN